MHLPHFYHLPLRIYDDAFEHVRDSDVEQGGGELHGVGDEGTNRISFLDVQASKNCEVNSPTS